MEDIKRKLIIEAYKRTIKDNRVIPTIESLMNKINYSDNRNALDCIYEDAKRLTNGEIFIESLEKNKSNDIQILTEELLSYLNEMGYMYKYNGKVYNPCQLTLF